MADLAAPGRSPFAPSRAKRGADVGFAIRIPESQNMPIPYSERRTFAIISHPDAGKTTLTEKLLVAGGAIHLAGNVKARGEARRARSD